MELWVHVRPRAARDSVGGLHDGALVVRVTAPPSEGRANTAVRRAVARAFGVAPSCVELVRGGASRRKRLHIEGDTRALEARRDELAASPRAPARD